MRILRNPMAKLLDLCQRTLINWSRCWGLSDCYTIIDFLLSLRIGIWFLYFFLLLCCSLFTAVNSVYLLFFSINNITFLPIKKKKKKRDALLHRNCTTNPLRVMWLLWSKFLVDLCYGRIGSYIYIEYAYKILPRAL